MPKHYHSSLASPSISKTFEWAMEIGTHECKSMYILFSSLTLEGKEPSQNFYHAT